MLKVVSGGMDALFRSLLAVTLCVFASSDLQGCRDAATSGVCHYPAATCFLKPVQKPGIPVSTYFSRMMGNARFELERPKVGSPALILLVLQWNRKRVRTSTKEYVLPEHWDKKTYRVAGRFLDADPEYYEVNRVLDELASLVRREFNDYRRQHRMDEFTPDTVRAVVSKYVLGDTPKENDVPTVAQYYRAYLDKRINAEHLSGNTLSGEESTYNHFVQFNAGQPSPVRFTESCLQLMERFRNYLWAPESGRADSTVHKNLRRFRQMLIHAQAVGVEIKGDANAIKIREHLHVSSEARDTIALYESDLRTIAELPLLEWPMLRRCRDLFLCGCYTGLRVNRWGEITSDNLTDQDGVKMLQLFTQKGKRKSVTIPLHPSLEKIFEYYDWSLPLVPSEVIINRSLKKIGRIAGFTDVIELAQNIQGRSVVKPYKRYELITTHTARRSFATNAAASGVPLEDIRAMTGQTMKTLLHYIKEDGKKRGVRIAKSNWFTKNTDE